jgi:SAM-dependent methyltransferase
MPVTKEDVINAYRFILGREPESESVIAPHLVAPDVPSLRALFLESAEFVNGERYRPYRPVDGHGALADLSGKGNDIDLSLAEGALAQLVARVGATWSSLGASTPHWSVLTEPRYRPGPLQDNLAEFFASGEAEARKLRAIISRCAPDFDLGAARCVEYGCGVGRLTAPLAALCGSLVACDISRPHLDLAERHVAELGIRNVSFCGISTSRLMPEAGYSLWYSWIVLQHNPPPIISLILDAAFAGLAEGGLAVFQLPTYAVGYSFNVRDYLAKPAKSEIEMHVLPQSHVFCLMRKHGLACLEVREDDSVGSTARFVSNVFVARKG